MRQLLLFLAFFALAHALAPTPAHADERVRIMAANLTSGNGQSYDPGNGIRIFQGLKPDIVLIQEFNYGDDSDASIRGFVDSTFGPEFYYYRESGSIPNGIISRYPILSSGEWDDDQVSNRDFAWAKIDIPGKTHLWAISLHFLTSSSGSRNSEAVNLSKLIKANIPTGDYLVLGGDLNTNDRDEGCINALTSVVVTTGPYPADQENNDNTNEGRSKPYDWVLVDKDLEARQTPLVIGSSTYASGLVFDSEVYTPLDEVAPVQVGDSHSTNMQHMGVARDFFFNAEIDGDGDGYTLSEGDCDDENPERSPGLPEVEDGQDNDCDSIVDNHLPTYDDDGDGQDELEGDCDDDQPAVYTGAAEVKDGLDNDCDGVVDNHLQDRDDDGDGQNELEGDCDDDDPQVFTGASEEQDGLDNDCDGKIDEGTRAYDDDLDGYTEEEGDCDDDRAGVNPDALEVTNGIDDNCDGRIDEEPGSGTPTPEPTGEPEPLEPAGCSCDQAVVRQPRGARGGASLLSGLFFLSAVAGLARRR